MIHSCMAVALVSTECCGQSPPEWSGLKYGFEPTEDGRDGNEEAQAGRGRGQAAAGGRAGLSGQSVAGAIGVSEVTYDRWRKEFGGLKSDQVRRMKRLETENARLRKAIADLTLDTLILQEAARGGHARWRPAGPPDPRSLPPAAQSQRCPAGDRGRSSRRHSCRRSRTSRSGDRGGADQKQGRAHADSERHEEARDTIERHPGQSAAMIRIQLWTTARACQKFSHTPKGIQSHT